MAFNVVELMPTDDEAFDQPCKFGHRVEGHAVYCHNDAWPDGPRKCRRTWYTGGEVKDEDCPGFQPNPAFKGELNPTPISGARCSQCGGTKLIKGDRDTVEICPRCMGDGAEPTAVAMSKFAQDTLELCLVHSGKHPAQFEYNVRLAESDDERADMSTLDTLGLIDIRSVSYAKAGVSAYLYRMTAKGDAVLRANWEARHPDDKERRDG